MKWFNFSICYAPNTVILNIKKKLLTVVKIHNSGLMQDSDENIFFYYMKIFGEK
jgi:hypothetical protein